MPGRAHVSPLARIRGGVAQARASRPLAASGRRARAGRAQPIEHRILVTATLCLLATGVVMVYSATSERNLLQGQGSSSYLIKFAIYGALGLVLMRLLARGKLDSVRRLTGPLLAASLLALVAVKLPHLGVQVNGARRWLGPRALQFQPSEFAKLALVLHAAALLARRPRCVRTLAELRPLLILVVAAAGLVALEPDIGTAFVIVLTLAIVLVAAGTPRRLLLGLAVGALTCVLLVALMQPYSRSRLTSFVNPWAHAGSSGFQAVQGQIALGSGGLFGRGPGQSVQKAFYLPAAQTDFILAVIGEEFGALGIAGVLFFYGLIAYAGLRTARRARSHYSALLAVGLTGLILCQALLNVFAVLGIAPLTGVPLPLVSYGASDLLVMLAAIGLLLNVAAGGSAHLRAVNPARRARPRAGPVRRDGPAVRGVDDAAAAQQRRWGDERASEADRDRRRRDRRARRAGARGGRRAAG